LLFIISCILFSTSTGPVGFASSSFASSLFSVVSFSPSFFSFFFFFFLASDFSPASVVASGLGASFSSVTGLASSGKLAKKIN